MPLSRGDFGGVNQLSSDSSALNVPAHRELPKVKVAIDDFGCQEADELLALIYSNPFGSLRDVPLMGLDRHVVAVREQGEVRNCQETSACGKFDWR
jgi:hypothetical protein